MLKILKYFQKLVYILVEIKKRYCINVIINNEADMRQISIVKSLQISTV